MSEARVLSTHPYWMLFWTVLLAMTIGACATQPPAMDTAQTGVRLYQGDPAAAPPGALLESEPFPTVDVRISRAQASATRITYRSTSGVDGAATAVTGVVFTPHIPPPQEGWPVVVYGHPGAGILENCAPSMYSDLLGNSAAIESLLAQGYLVVMPDYQGIGSAGPHPYLEPMTLGYNMIDAVRAARELEPRAGTRWASYGISEGGEAAWSAAELAPSYGQGLDMVAAVALNPLSNLAALPQLAMDGKLNTDQLPVMLYIANTVAALHPEVPVEDYLRGYSLEKKNVLMGCVGAELHNRAAASRGMSPADFVPASPVAAEQLARILQVWSLPGPQAPAQVPVLVVVGARDQTARPEWTRAAVDAACAQGERITLLIRRGDGHDDLHQQQAEAWLEGQFTGTSVDVFVGESEGTVCNGL